MPGNGDEAHKQNRHRMRHDRADAAGDNHEVHAGTDHGSGNCGREKRPIPDRKVRIDPPQAMARRRRRDRCANADP